MLEEVASQGHPAQVTEPGTERRHLTPGKIQNTPERIWAMLYTYSETSALLIILASLPASQGFQKSRVAIPQ